MSTRVVILAVALGLAPVYGQTQRPPYLERFESAVVPALPAGWHTSANRSAGGDFSTTTSVVYADSIAVVSTNATVEQSLTTPLLDFSGLLADSLTFYERRSGTHNAGLLVEASLDGGESYTAPISDTLRNAGTTAYVRRSMKFPAILDGQPEVRLRFRVAGNGTGTTGTIRFDNILVGARAQLDAALSRIALAPAVPNAGDSVTVTATVRNAGIEPVSSVSVSFFADRNRDGVIDPAELFATGEIHDTLHPLDSVLAGARLGGLTTGRTLLVVALMTSGDQMSKNDTLTRILDVGMPRRAVVINELMYAPPANEPEWIELTNTTDSEISLKEWKLSNRNNSNRYLLTGTDRRLQPSGYALVTKDSALLRLAHPAIDAMIIASPAMPTFLWNNSGDAAVLYDNVGAAVDSVHYIPSWGGQDGRSLERVEPSGPSLDPLNWGTSQDSSGSTPGKQNFLTPLDTNLQLKRLGMSIDEGGSVNLTALVVNAGRTPATGFSITFSRDADGNGSAGELIAETFVAQVVEAADSIALTARWPSAPSGRQHIIGLLSYAADMRSSDNLFIDTVQIPFRPSCLVINEIMFDPLEGDAEYVELYNRSAAPIDVQGWQLADRRDPRNDRPMTDVPLDVRPGDYLVVAGDTGILRRFGYLDAAHLVVPRASPALNNSGDDVLLIDLSGRTIDSVHYLADWHNALIDDPAGRSLERINADLPSTDKRNWGTSADPLGGSPGKANSLHAPVTASGATLSCAPNPFSPDGDAHEDMTVIAYNLPHSAALIRIRIFDSVGRPVRVLADGEPSGPEGSIVWDGMTDHRLKAPVGIYILLLEALDSSGGEVEKTKGLVVVAGQM